MSEGSVILRVILVPWGSMAPPDFTWEEQALSSTTHTQGLQQAHPRGPSSPGTGASAPSTKPLLAVPPDPVSLPTAPRAAELRDKGRGQRAALPAAHLIGPVPTAVTVGGHDDHLLEVWDFWARGSRENITAAAQGWQEPAGTALHPNRPHLGAPWCSRESPGPCSALDSLGFCTPSPQCSPQAVPTPQGYARPSCWCWPGRCTRGSWC